MTFVARIVAVPIKAYRLIFSPWVGHNCRYQPTCSAYALEALEKHGALRGTWLAARRVLSCHPWGGSGIDNVPNKLSGSEGTLPSAPCSGAHPRKK
ncbi:MAG: membrane protein insertion efficiency factor YidD [Pseudomonadota bacterium]